VNYSEQKKYLVRGRVWAAVCAFITVYAFLGVSTNVVMWNILFGLYGIPLITAALIVVAIGVSLFYTPDYLHLNVNRSKRSRWQIKIRWRLFGAGMVFGLLGISRLRDVAILLAAGLWFVGASLVAKTSVPPRYSSAYFWFTDSALIAGLILAGQGLFVVMAALVMAAGHLAIVTSEEKTALWGSFVAASSFLLAWIANSRSVSGRIKFLTWAAPILMSAAATVWLVIRAQRQNARNVREAMQELMQFTGYSDEKIGELWTISNEQLAKNWKAAQLDENDREKMTEWYRENSELYMFAISGYNLEYKRIRDNIKMLEFGRGACLDYGAGNGEIILELARRGHAVIYFDVDGTSMKFAQMRAERQKLAVEFFHSKEDLAAAARKHGLDTIFSFDVLEHLPDLPGELKFLSSMLNPGGLLVFDVPAGSTKSHPMHLSHHLDIHAHMESIGMKEERSVWQSIPFRKQEKYIYRKRA
jgi:2-polyprenyl-3-methyl-5-hydroxy-6-metoxy-1,4-benzoquinol methylase